MLTITEKITKQIDSLQKKIDSLSGNYLTNTWKRQQEQKWRDTKTEHLRAQKQVLEHLLDESHSRNLTDMESALAVGAFYETMRALLSDKEYCDNRPQHSYSFQFPSKLEAMSKRLNKAGIFTTDELIIALVDFKELVRIAVKQQNPTIKKIRDMTFHARLMQKGDIQFTPEKLADRLVALSGIDETSKTLEPSAAIGCIADKIKEVTCQVDCIEIEAHFKGLLKLKGHNVIGSDFIESAPHEIYDAVLMNPPFSDECRHIRHAYDFLKPGGTLVSVCCARISDSDNKKYDEFREWLHDQRFMYEAVGEKFEMTGTNTKILVIEKPVA